MATMLNSMSGRAVNSCTEMRARSMSDKAFVHIVIEVCSHQGRAGARRWEERADSEVYVMQQ